MKIRYILPISGLLLVMGMGGCMADNQVLAEMSSYTVLAKGVNSGIDTKEFRVIKNPDTFSKIWQQAFAHQKPVPELPTVDFTKNMVLALFMGQKRTGGYSIRLVSIESYPDSVVAHVVLHAPGSGCRTTQMITSPFMIVKTGITGKDVIFETFPESRNCR